MTAGTSRRWVTPPPAGSPWDDPIESAAMAFVDLEMTGLKPEIDRVIEVCRDRVAGHARDTFTTLVRPDDDRFGNEKVHGITRACVADAPTFSEIADRVVALLDGAVLVAHGAQYDVAFLEAELARVGKPKQFSHYLDTLTLARRVFGFKSHALASLAEAFSIPTPRAHRAADDVGTMRAVFERTVTELQPRTLRDLWHVKVGARAARPQVLESLARACSEGVPVRVRYRPSGKPPAELLFVVTKVRSELDPPHVLGYLLPGRGRRELRADRILSVSPP